MVSDWPFVARSSEGMRADRYLSCRDLAHRMVSEHPEVNDLCLSKVGSRRSAADGGRCREGPLTDPIADVRLVGGNWSKCPNADFHDRHLIMGAEGGDRAKQIWHSGSFPKTRRYAP